MGRVLSLLLILVLAISHGSMSASVPHSDGMSHQHALENAADPHSDEIQLAEADSAEQATLNAPDDTSGKVPHGMGHHVHVVTDGVPSSVAFLFGRRQDKGRKLPVDDAALRSMDIDPLAEPPLA